MKGRRSEVLVIRERSHMTSARFWQILPPLPPVSYCYHWADPPPPLMTSAFARPPPPFKSDVSVSKNPLHSTLIETLNVYLIQLKTERCQVNCMCNHNHIIEIKHQPAISLGEYIINAVVSRIVIGPLDLKQFLPKSKYFLMTSARLRPPPPPPCQQPSAFWYPPPPFGCWRHMWTLPNIIRGRSQMTLSKNLHFNPPSALASSTVITTQPPPPPNKKQRHRGLTPPPPPPSNFYFFQIYFV